MASIDGEETSALSEEQRKRFIKLKNIAREILETEKTYVENLQLVVELYVEPLRSKILSKNQFTTLFSNIETLLTLNKKFLTDIEERVSNWNLTQCIGDVFLRFAPYFKMYSLYTGNQEKVLDLLEELNHNKKFQKFCNNCRMDPRCKANNLKSFLILPVQRIPRYKLLLEQLAKYTPNEHPDFKQINESLNIVSKVANELNEEIKSKENRNAILEIQNKFEDVGTLVAPHRIFLFEGGPFVMTSHFKLTSSPVSKDQAMLFLFNDSLLIGNKQPKSGNSSKFHMAHQIPIELSLKIEKLPSGLSLETTQNFLLIELPNDNDRNCWFEKISELIKNCGNNELLKAVRIGDAKEVENLLEQKKGDLNVKDKYGWTPLMIAASSGRHEIIDILIRYEVDNIDAVSTRNQTALIISVLGCKRIVIERLFTLKPDITVTDEEGDTALSLALKLCSLAKDDLNSFQHRMSLSAVPSHHRPSLDIERFVIREIVLFYAFAQALTTSNLPLMELCIKASSEAGDYWFNVFQPFYIDLQFWPSSHSALCYCIVSRHVESSNLIMSSFDIDFLLENVEDQLIPIEYIVDHVEDAELFTEIWNRTLMQVLDEIFELHEVDFEELCTLEEGKYDDLKIHLKTIEAKEELKNDIIWVQYKSSDGVPYYFNTETKESVWVLPNNEKYSEGEHLENIEIPHFPNMEKPEGKGGTDKLAISHKFNEARKIYEYHINKLKMLLSSLNLRKWEFKRRNALSVFNRMIDLKTDLYLKNSPISSNIGFNNLDEHGLTLLNKLSSIRSDWSLDMLNAIVSGPHSKAVFAEEIKRTSSSGLTPLIVACAFNNIEAVDVLIRIGMDINVTGINRKWGPLHVAAFYNHKNILSRLSTEFQVLIPDFETFSVEEKNNEKIRKSSSVRMRNSIVNRLNIAIADENGRTALHIAALNNNFEAAQFLAHFTSFSMLKDNEGKTALDLARNEDLKKTLSDQIFYRAVCLGDVELVKELIKLGCDINSKGPQDKTPLIMASRLGFYEIVEILVESGCSVSDVDSKGWNALMHAVDSKSYDVTQILLNKKGFDIDQKSEDEGLTALMIAAKAGSVEIVKLFFKHEPNLDLTSKQGLKAENYAEKVEIEELFAEQKPIIELPEAVNKVSENVKKKVKGKCTIQ